MNVFTIQVPDGRKIKIQAADQATAIHGAQEYVASHPAASAKPSVAVNPDVAALQQAHATMPHRAEGTPEQIAAAQSAIDAVPDGHDLGSQVLAGVTSGIDAVPIVGPAVMGGLRNIKSAGYGVSVDKLASEEKAARDANPVASTIGGVAGTVLPFVAGGEIPAVAKVLGMDGAMALLPRTLLSAGTNAAIGAGDAAVRGRDPVTGAIIGGIGGAVAPAAGDALGALGDKWAAAATRARQAKLTDAAIATTPATAQDVRSAGSKLFEDAYGKTGGGPMVSSPAIDRLWNDVSNATSKFRPNAANDPKAVGLLSHLSELVDAAKTPGTAVDLQDLHLARQLAGKVAQSPDGRDSAIGGIVINKIDNFIRSLKPGDILGGADPKAAANSLIKGISTWNRALKAGVVESAVEKAQGYKSGVELGLKSTFSNLMKSKDFSRFNQAEQDAIRQVAKGTTKQNIAALFGKMGLSIGLDGAHNILGAGLGTSGLTAALTPVLGPAALPAALTATTLAGAAGRATAKAAAEKSAERAVRVVAAPHIPTAPQAANPIAWTPELMQALLRSLRAPPGVSASSAPIAVPAP